MMNISAIIPAFNEEENLKILLPLLHKTISPLCDKYELLVVDSKKTEDNSQEVCKKNNAVYIKQKNIGYGDAFRTGIDKALYEAVVVVDADLSQDISQIPLMYDKLTEGFDVVIGSRYVKGGVTTDPFVSVAMSKILNITYRFVLGFKEKDVSTDFRFYRKQLLKEIDTSCINFDVIEETLFLLKRKYPALKVHEVPIVYKPRNNGSSKRNLFLFIGDYMRLIVKLFRLKF